MVDSRYARSKTLPYTVDWASGANIFYNLLHFGFYLCGLNSEYRRPRPAGLLVGWLDSIAHHGAGGTDFGVDVTPWFIQSTNCPVASERTVRHGRG